MSGERIDVPNTYPIGEGESEGAWTDRLLHMARIHGTYRQCSIGWHGECSQRDQGADAECNCICHDPADVRSPEPAPAPEPDEDTRQVEVSWWHTETFTALIPVPDDFDLEADDVDEQLEALICLMDDEEMNAAFTACTEREITEKEEVQ